MKKLLAAILGRLLVAFLAIWIGTVIPAQAGSLTLLGAGHPPTSGGGGGYTGPGNVTGAVAYYGLRAYSAATRGTRAVNVCLPAGTPCADFLTDATTGDLITTATGVTTCNNTTVICVINTWYDQAGALSTPCTGGTCDVINSTALQQEILVLSCTPGGKPCAQTVASESPYTSVGSLSQSQPYMISWVGKELGNNGSYAGIVDLVTGWPNATNLIFIWAGGGSIVTVSALANVWHATQALFNGNTLSTLYIDGSSNAAANIGTNGLSGVINHTNGNTNGQIVEFFIINGDQSANNSTMDTNEKTYWGY